MKKIKSKLQLLALASGALVVSSAGAFAAADDAYSANDLLLFFQNPAGSTGTDKVVYYSLGSTYNVFRDAATPSSANFGSTISLGNINTILTSTYGSDWTGGASTIFTGAAGQNGNTSGLSTAVDNADYARTVYVTKARSGAGSVGVANSSSPLFNPSATAVAGQISGSNNISGMTQPGVVGVGDTLLDGYNSFSSGNPSTAYGAISGGIQTSLGSSFIFGSINNVVAALDLYRVTKTTGTNATSANSALWHNANSITATYSDNSYTGSAGARADYLGTVTLGSNGDLNLTAVGAAAVPEPSTYAQAAIALAIAAFFIARKRFKTVKTK
jgi:hypothetical protein